MLNPLTRSQGKQNISLINSQEKVNTLQDKLVRDFFKKKQTNRSLIDVKPKIKSNTSSSISSKEFFFPLINNDIKDVHSYSQNNKDILFYYKDNIETIYMNMKKIIDSINLINDNLNKNDSILIEESQPSPWVNWWSGWYITTSGARCNSLPTCLRIPTI